MSSPLSKIVHRILGQILPLCLAFSSATNSSAGDLPMAEPESVGVSSGRLGRLTDSMQRYIDSDKLCLLYTSPSPRDQRGSG